MYEKPYFENLVGKISVESDKPRVENPVNHKV